MAITRASIDVGHVGPNQSSGVQVSAGFYSLSSRSNTPYVSLIGASGFFKMFSWGETVEVPCGQICTVKNESYHGGDIFLNVGIDPCNAPARITVPVPFELGEVEGAGFFIPKFPADVRRARQAYLVHGGRTIQAETPIIIIGIRSDGSHDTPDQIQTSGVGLPGVGYTDGYQWPAFTDLNIPLGFRTAPGDRAPHVLLTTACAYISDLIEQGDTLAAAYYVMEY